MLMGFMRFFLSFFGQTSAAAGDLRRRRGGAGWVAGSHVPAQQFGAYQALFAVRARYGCRNTGDAADRAGHLAVQVQLRICALAYFQPSLIYICSLLHLCYSVGVCFGQGAWRWHRQASFYLSTVRRRGLSPLFHSGRRILAAVALFTGQVRAAFGASSSRCSWFQQLLHFFGHRHVLVILQEPRCAAEAVIFANGRVHRQRWGRVRSCTGCISGHLLRRHAGGAVGGQPSRQSQMISSRTS